MYQGADHNVPICQPVKNWSMRQRWLRNATSTRRLWRIVADYFLGTEVTESVLCKKKKIAFFPIDRPAK